MPFSWKATDSQYFWGESWKSPGFVNSGRLLLSILPKVPLQFISTLNNIPFFRKINIPNSLYDFLLKGGKNQLILL